ncbi:MAG: sodium-dependent transporter [Clostridiales bacterium]|nr:sodium-dependent transporter [Clostridiales bacterium]
MNSKKPRATFSGSVGFVISAAASAIGLGNIWRFPYLAAKYGGGIFLIIYIILALTLGFTLMTTEIAIGRNTRLSVIGAYRKLNEKWAFLGVLSSVVPIVIMCYYCVIGGWVLKYAVVFLSGNGARAASDFYFSEFISGVGQPLSYWLVFTVVSFALVATGLEKGIEGVSKILMPALGLLLLLVTAYSLTLPGAMGGLKYYLYPDFSKLSGGAVLGAMGQMFYSMSLAMGIMVTYGSYMKKEENIEKAVKRIEIFDTAAAFLAGMMIVPAVFVFSGGDESAMQAGPGLMFVTLPKLFVSMGRASGFIGFAFFLLVLFAAITSYMSVIEAVVSVFQDRLHVGRRRACLIAFAIVAALGGVVSLGFGPLSGVSAGGMSMLDMLDFFSNSVIMPIVALCTCVFIGFALSPDFIVDEVKKSSPFGREKIYRALIKYVAPLAMLAILISSVLNGLGIITI